MLREWQIKFPSSFASYPDFLTTSAPYQLRLSEILTSLDERGLLNEAVVSDLLNKSKDNLDDVAYLYNLRFLIEQLIRFTCLDTQTLNMIFTSPTALSPLAHCVRDLLVLPDATPEALLFLLRVNNPEICVAFIQRVSANRMSMGAIIAYLSYQIALDGLSRALTLFDLSHIAYQDFELEQFIILTTTLANPLCQTIFDARLRCFSDYQLDVVEPVDTRSAEALIRQLHALPDEESRNKTFFNFFAALRSLPCSQKYIVEIDTNKVVKWTLTSYVESTIDAIDSLEKYETIHQMIRNLLAVGGDKAIFDAIKYKVGAYIESADMLSMRSYEGLMDDIWLALHKPQPEIAPLREKLDGTQWPLLMAGAGMRRLSLNAEAGGPAGAGAAGSNMPADIDDAVLGPMC